MHDCKIDGWAVVQGDTLNELVNQLARMKSLLEAGDLEEVAAEIELLSELLAGALAGFKTICAQHSIDTPFS